MKNLRKSEIVDYIQERYNPETMPEILLMCDKEVVEV